MQIRSMKLDRFQHLLHSLLTLFFFPKDDISKYVKGNFSQVSNKIKSPYYIQYF